MEPSEHVVVVLDHFRISPPPGTVSNKSLPLTFFDIPWLNYPPIKSLLFYEFPQTTTHFMQTFIPNLKHTLSLTLKHYFPLAGNLILFPPTCTNMPEIRYVDGDSVSLIVCESNYDFKYLTDQIPRNMTQLLSLVPQLPKPTKSFDNSTLSPLLALQVTLFPNYGISIGMTHHHAVGDGCSMAGFRKAWALITKHNCDGPFLSGEALPLYDRTLIKDPNGLFQIYWGFIQKTSKPLEFQSLLIPSPSMNKMVRASFVISPAHILKLKRVLLDGRNKLVHVSSFVVVCGYVWSCLAKFRVAMREEVSEDEIEYFSFAANSRPRLDPSLPETYFGNCISPCIASAKSTELVGKEGFLTGCELIGEAISFRVDNEEGVLHGAEKWLSDIASIMGRRVLGVTGSPKFSLHDIDFGFGMPIKIELGFQPGSITLNGCKDFEGGLEVGMSFLEDQMDAFAHIFTDGLG